ncbi:MAG: type II toxin-antitoxin system death-on-curing family toxin [Bacteroidia bacterium]
MFLDRKQIIDLHGAIIAQSGGASGLRDQGAFDSCLLQPFQGFGETEFYSSILDKSIAFGYFLVVNHPFIDGNKRIGHAVMVVNLDYHGYEIEAATDEQEKLILDLASGILDKETFFQWVKDHLQPLSR